MRPNMLLPSNAPIDMHIAKDLPGQHLIVRLAGSPQIVLRCLSTKSKRVDVINFKPLALPATNAIGPNKSATLLISYQHPISKRLRDVTRMLAALFFRWHFRHNFRGNFLQCCDITLGILS